MRARQSLSHIAAAMLLVATLGGGQQASAAPVAIARMTVAGHEHVAPETILGAARRVAKEGERVADLPATLEAMRREVMLLGYFQDVSVTGAPQADGAALTITVRERTRVTQVSFDGGTVFSDEDLLKIVRTRPGLFLDRRVMERDAERIGEAYDERGILARVAHVDANEKGEVAFRIQEVRVADVRFAGLRAVTQAEARERFGLAPGALLSNEEVSAALKRLQDTGWFDHVGLSLGRDAALGDAAAIIVVSLTERAMLHAERIGRPRADIDPGRLRADVGVIRLDLQYQSTVTVNDFLLDMADDAQATLERLERAAAAEGASPQAQLQYARGLSAVGRDPEAVALVETATARLRGLLEQQPDDLGLLLSLGEALGILGEHAEALGTLRRAAALAPDRWAPRVEFARVAADHLLAEFGKALAARSAAESPPPISRMSALRAVVEMMPWENTRRAMLERLDGEGEPDEDVLLGREAAAHLAEARRLAPDEPAVLRACFSAMLGTAFSTLGAMGHRAEAWEVINEDAATFIDSLGALTQTDPGLALWSAFFTSFQAVLALAGRYGADASEEQMTAELARLARNLTEVTERWPRALRTSGSMLGILQFIAGERDLARATFEDAVRQNPYDRQNYTALLGLAFDAGELDNMERIVRQRMAVAPAAEDHVLLGKLAERHERPDEVARHFREAVAQFPGDAIGHAALAGWLVHTGADDAEAEGLLDRALALDPHHAYAHAVRAALRLLQGKPDEAVAAIRAALRANPDEELAMLLRERYFGTQQGG